MLASINIKNLNYLDHIVTLSTIPTIKSMSDALKRGEELQPITVAKVNDEYYILDGYARVEAHKLANIDSVKAYVIELKSKEEAQLWHIRLNIRSSLNILKLYEALKHHNKDINSLGLDETMLKIIKRLDRIKGRAYTRLAYYLDILRQRFARVPQIPYYIIVLVSELEDEELQERAVDFAFINIEDREDVFSYQDYDRMLSFIKILKSRDISTKNAMDNKISYVKTSNIIKKGTKIQYYKGELVNTFTCECGKIYAVSAKSSKGYTINEVEEHNDLIVIKGSNDSLIHIVPNDVVELLGLDSHKPMWHVVDAYKIIELLPFLNGKVAILTVE